MQRRSTLSVPKMEKRQTGILGSFRHKPSHKKPSPWRHLLDRKANRMPHKVQVSHAPPPVAQSTTTTTLTAVLNVMLGGGTNEERASFGTRQARDAQRPSASQWTERPGWDSPTMLCERRFSRFPDLIVYGTNQAYDEIKRRVTAKPNETLPLYLGARLARDDSANEWRVRPDLDVDSIIANDVSANFPVW